MQCNHVFYHVAFLMSVHPPTHHSFSSLGAGAPFGDQIGSQSPVVLAPIGELGGVWENVSQSILFDFDSTCILYC